MKNYPNKKRKQKSSTPAVSRMRARPVSRCPCDARICYRPPGDSRIFSDGEIRQFIDKGFVLLRGAFSSETAERCRYVQRTQSLCNIGALACSDVTNDKSSAVNYIRTRSIRQFKRPQRSVTLCKFSLVSLLIIFLYFLLFMNSKGTFVAASHS